MHIPILVLVFTLCATSAFADSAIYFSPAALASTLDGKQLFVACATAKRLLVFDTASEKITKT
jgi:hypothetical protein